MNEKIGIFDSGIGGVTVLKEILTLLPYENYIYYSDSLNNPYGDKNDADIFSFCDNIVKYFLSQNCKAIVIACNTASAKCADKLRKLYKNIPVIAIEPAYKMVHDFSYNKNTLVMATQGTIKSEKFHNLYTKYNNHHTILLACKGLANIIEGGNSIQLQDYLTTNLSKYSGKIENVVLGCTHYPLIQDEIRKVLGDVTFYNGAKGVATQLKNLLQKNKKLSTRFE